MNKRETVDVAFLAAVIIILFTTFVYVNIGGEKEEDEGDGEDADVGDEIGDRINADAGEDYEIDAGAEEGNETDN